MNVLKALFDNSIDESDLLTSSAFEKTELLDIAPSWASVNETQAIVSDAIAPNALGHVKFHGTRWRAYSQLSTVLTVGTVVTVVGRQRSNILVVEPVSAALS